MEYVFSAVAFLLGLAGAYFLTRPRITAAEEGLKAAQAELSKVQQELAAMKVRAEAAAKLEEQIAQRDAHIQSLKEELHEYETKRAAMEADIAARERNLREQLDNFEKFREQMRNEFAALSQDVLNKSNETFLQLANENLKRRERAVDELVKPIQEGLVKLNEQTQKIEEKRTEAYASITEQFKSLTETQNRLQLETSNLVRALRAPQQRGRWGEIQLKRVVEMAGMLEHCDFEQQASTDTETGRQRPDLIVHMPSDRKIAVDSKTVLDAYLSAAETQDEAERQLLLKKHAKQVRDQIVSLSSKNYWETIGSVEFVVLFLPGEPFFSAALEQDPTLIEFGNENRVLIATPTTLIALLKAVAYGWRQEKLAENAEAISKLGKDLYSRIRKMAEHLEQLGKNIDRTVRAYNDTIGTLETRVLPSARKFQEYQASPPGETIQPIVGLDRTARVLSAPDLIAQDEPGEG